MYRGVNNDVMNDNRSNVRNLTNELSDTGATLNYEATTGREDILSGSINATLRCTTIIEIEFALRCKQRYELSQRLCTNLSNFENKV